MRSRLRREFGRLRGHPRCYAKCKLWTCALLATFSGRSEVLESERCRGNRVNRAATYATAIVVAHLLVNIAHGLAHRELRIGLPVCGSVFVIVVVLVYPLLNGARLVHPGDSVTKPLRILLPKICGESRDSGLDP